LAGPVKELVVHQRWIMYSLFIGLTLGGVPVVGRLIRAAGGMNRAAWFGVVAGFAGMAALAYVQMRGAGGDTNEGFAFMLLAGVAGASAMILPGVSGGYLLLVLGVYVPILAAISDFKDAARAGDAAALLSIGGTVILPVGVGVIVGVVGVSNALKWLLAKFERPTLGVLLGLLLGAVVGLYPFVEGVMPEAGATVKGQEVHVDTAGERYLMPSGRMLEPEDYPIAVFTPSGWQVVGAVGLIAGGFAGTMLIDRFGRERKPRA
jgi:putative membrane protein